MEPDVGLPPGWEMGVDPATGVVYYCNASLNVTQWEHPLSEPFYHPAELEPPQGDNAVWADAFGSTTCDHWATEGSSGQVAATDVSSPYPLDVASSSAAADPIPAAAAADTEAETEEKVQLERALALSLQEQQVAEARSERHLEATPSQSVHAAEAYSQPQQPEVIPSESGPQTPLPVMEGLSIHEDGEELRGTASIDESVGIQPGTPMHGRAACTEGAFQTESVETRTFGNQTEEAPSEQRDMSELRAQFRAMRRRCEVLEARLECEGSVLLSSYRRHHQDIKQQKAQLAAQAAAQSPQCAAAMHAWPPTREQSELYKLSHEALVDLVMEWQAFRGVSAATCEN